MKFILTLCFLLSFHLVSCQDSDGKVPEAVQKSFEAKYPGENDPDWGIDSNGNYEAHFKKKGEKYRADFAPAGNWIETENSIKASELPKVIQDIIRKDYFLFEISEVEHVMHFEKGEFFDVEFKQKGKNKDVEFDINGNVLN